MIASRITSETDICRRRAIRVMRSRVSLSSLKVSGESMVSMYGNTACITNSIWTIALPVLREHYFLIRFRINDVPVHEAFDRTDSPVGGCRGRTSRRGYGSGAGQNRRPGSGDRGAVYVGGVLKLPACGCSIDAAGEHATGAGRGNRCNERARRLLEQPWLDRSVFVRAV